MTLCLLTFNRWVQLDQHKLYGRYPPFLSEGKVTELEVALTELKSANAEQEAELECVRAEAASLKDSASGDAAAAAEARGQRVAE